MKKRIISLILVISVLLSVFPVSVLTTAAEGSAVPATRDGAAELQSDDDLEINSSAVSEKNVGLAETKSNARENRIKIFLSPYGQGYNHITALNNETDTGFAQEPIYAWYILYDGNTGDLLNTYQDSDYAVKLAIYDPNGDLVDEYNYTGSHDANWIRATPQMSGTYVAVATLTGDLSAEVTATYEVSYDADISSSVSSISLNLNGTKSITPIVTISGNYPGDYGVRYQLGNSEIASAAWSGVWDGHRTSITVTGKKPGTTNLTLSIYENYTGNKNIVDSITIPVTVTAGTLSVNTSNTATVYNGGDIKYFTYTPSTSGTYVIYSTGSVDTRVYLYNSSGTELDNDDDSGDGNNFRLEYNLTAGTKYTFGVKYYDSTIVGTISFTFGNVYTITYSANGGTGAPSSQKKDYGTDITLSTSNPTRSGYTFLGWSTSSTSSTATYQPDSTFRLNANTTLYAVWKSNVAYSITYNANGGSGAPSTQTGSTNYAISSTVPTRFGYTFLGWSTSSSATTSTYEAGDTIAISGNLTLYAVWKSATTLSVGSSYAAKIDFADQEVYYAFTPASSGTYTFESTGAVDSKIYVYNASGTELDNDDDSSDEGTNFKLMMNLTGGTKYFIKVRAYSNYTGTIGFSTTGKYTVTYNANGGSNAPSNQTKTHGTALTLSTVIPSRSGYTFLGWSTSSTATTAAYQPGATFTSNQNIVLYAVWETNSYDVSYSANGGSGAPATQIKTHGVGLTLSPTIPYRLGYTFLGWSKNSTATTPTYYPKGTFTSNQDSVLYAVWKQNILSSGSSNTAQINFEDQMYYYKFTPSKSGDYVIYSTGSTDTRVYLYNANGTQLSSDDDGGENTNFRLEYDLSAGTTYIFGVRYYSSSNTGTISFKFGEVYTIDYIAEDADIVPVGHYKDYGTDVTLSDLQPKRNNYTFLGWSTSSTATTAEYQPGATFTSNQNTVLYAVWEANSYDVSYSANGGSGAPASQTKTYGVGLTLSSTIPFRMGYTFLGWSTNRTATTAEYLPEDYFTSDSDTTLYAVWKQTTLYSASSNTAQINFENQMYYYKFTPSKSGNYVIYSSGSADTIVCLFDEYGTELSRNDDGGENRNFRLEHEFTAGTTYFFGVRYYHSSDIGSISLKFGEVYTINYSANGGSGAPSSQDKDYGSDITLSDTEPLRSGYTFLGWSTSSMATNAEYQPGDDFTFNSDTTLYAVWKQNRELIDMNIVLCTVESCYIGDSLNVTALQLNLTYSDGTTEFITSGYTISGFDSSASGTKTVTVSYQGFTDTFTVTVNTPSLALSSYSKTLKKGNTTTITATTTPSSQSVTWTSSDPNVATVSNGVITAKAKGTTNITAKFTYNGITYSNTCVVNCIEPVGVEIDTLPNKTVFYVGDHFERVGLRLKMLYSDGSYESGWGVTSTSLDEVAVFLSEGTRNVLVYCGDFSTSYQITVNPIYAKLLTTEAKLNVGQVSQITYETSPGDMSQLANVIWSSSNTNVARVDQNGLVTAVGIGTAEITLNIVNGGCGTKSNICTVTVSKKINDISISKAPAKAIYYIGDALNTSGLELRATYDDGTSETITSGFTTSGFVSSTPGTKTVTVSYEGFTDIFTVTVNTPSIVLSSGSKTLKVGESSTVSAITTPSGQTVIWTSSDTNVATVSNGIITAKSKGTTNITAEFTYNGIKYSEVCSVTVIELTSISVSQEPTITQYYVGDSLDISGLKLKLTYSDGSRATITRDFTTSGFDSSTPGTKTITVSYEGFTDTFTVTVNTPSIVLSSNDEMLEEGDTTTLTATTTPSSQSVTWTSSNTNVATVSNGVITAKTKGTANITAEFTYNGITYREVCSVTVIEEEIVLTSMVVFQEPTKTIYYLGDTFDRSGLTIQVHYSNGDVSLLSGGFVTSGFNSTTVGTKTIRVSYQGLTDKFTVTVNTPSVAISSSSKTLNIGDTAILTATTTPSGQSVTWTSSDTSVVTVSNGKVIAVGEGTAAIRADFTYNGVVYSQECVVVVFENKLGDVDGDSKVTVMDATLVQRHVAQINFIVEDRLSCADVDKDGKISVVDATIIQRFVAQLIPKL